VDSGALNDLVLVQGARDTRGALARWKEDPWPVLSSWFAGGLAVAIVLLFVVWLVALVARPDLTSISIPGVTEPPRAADMLPVLYRNSLVLALHAMACVAGFIAGSSLPLSAAKRTGLSRLVHEKARPVAFAWVIAVTCFSLTTQAYVLGSTGSTLAYQLGISPGVLILTALPHALIELTALFLPLAAWTIASRRNEWGDLLAATVVTVAVAIPMLLFSAAWEVFLWPRLLEAASPIA
jgi:hypothetical protein